MIEKGSLFKQLSFYYKINYIQKRVAQSSSVGIASETADCLISRPETSNFSLSYILPLSSPTSFYYFLTTYAISYFTK